MGLNPEAFKNHLYIPRNVEGEQNKEQTELLRKLEEVLKRRPEFVGLAPSGSVMKGYSNEKSDFDVWVVVDSSCLVSPLDCLNSSSEEFKEFTEQGMHVLILHIANEIDIGSYEYMKDNKKFEPRIVGAVATLTGLVTGSKIDKYRDQICQKIKRLTLEQQSALKNQVMDILAYRDRMSIDKIIKRIPELDTEDIIEIINGRDELWQKRWDEVWER